MLVYYSLFIQFAYTLYFSLPIGNKRKKKQMQDIRASSLQELSEFRRLNPDTQTICIHCSSTGEYEQAKPLISYLKERTELPLILSFFSPSGYLEVQDSHIDLKVMMPMDTFEMQSRWVNLLNPKVFVFCKYDVMPVLIKELRARMVSIYLFSAVFRSSQIYFKWYGGLMRRALKRFDQVFVQDNNSVKLLAKVGVKNVKHSGDTRLDRVVDIAKKSFSDDRIQQFCEHNSERQIWVAGSIWAQDDHFIAHCMDRIKSVAFILAPHEVHPQRIKELRSKFQQYGCVLYSGSEPISRKTRCLIVDTTGILASTYRFGKVAYIGNGFGASGIHNTMEAAAYGIPTVFGPNYKKFLEAVALVNRGGAFSFRKKEELVNIATSLQDENVLKEISTLNLQYVQANSGATEKIGRLIEKLFN